MTKALLITLSLLAYAPGLFAAKIDCTKPADATFKAVSAKPETVLQIVTADVAASPKCACPIVKAAISASSADKNLQGDIVAAAINAAPEEAAAIKVCIPPQAYGKGMSGKEPVAITPTGKQSGAAPQTPQTAQTPTPEAYDGWFDPLIYGAGGSGVVGGAGGVYTSSPSGGGGGGGIDKTPGEIITIIEGGGSGPRIIVKPATRT
jgi:hypothetical protein